MNHETQRLRYEPVSTAHAERMYPILTDPQIYKYLPEKAPASVEALRKRYEFLSDGKSPDGTEYWLNWMLFKKESGEPIGFYQATVRPENCSIAFALNPRYWRYGYATEAGIAIISHIFDTYNTPTVTAEINHRNKRSIRLVRRLGFSFIRHESKDDDDIYVITRAQWLKKHKQDLVGRKLGSPS